MSDNIETQDYTFSLIGGNIALDFSNTVGNRAAGAPLADRDEHIKSYADLARWAEQTGVVNATEANSLREQAEQKPAQAEQVYRRAIALREAIYNAFHALAEDEQIAPEYLATLNAEFSEAANHLRLLPADHGLARGWPETELGLEKTLWPVAWAASELLIGEDRHKVRQCADDSCGWLFVDQSRNHSRQWCDMKDCGNKNKARRHYQRSRAQKAAN